VVVIAISWWGGVVTRKVLIFLNTCLVWYGVLQTFQTYGVLYLLAYIPIVYFWGYFWGVPPLIGLLKIRDIFTKERFAGLVTTQIISVCLLFGLLNLLGVNQILPTVIIVGVLTGLTMETKSLREEHVQYMKQFNLPSRTDESDSNSD